MLTKEAAGKLLKVVEQVGWDELYATLHKMVDAACSEEYYDGYEPFCKINACEGLLLLLGRHQALFRIRSCTRVT